MYARPSDESGNPLSFLASGKLWRDALVLFDNDSGDDHWSQVTGTAIKGKAKGKRLDFVPSTLTTWAAWRAQHPNTLVLRKPEPIEGSHYERYFKDENRMGISGDPYDDDRLPGKALVLGILIGDRSYALDFGTLDRLKIVNVTLDGVPVVLTRSPEANTAQAYRRTVGGRVVELENFRMEKGIPVMSVASGSVTFSLLDGTVVHGEAEALEPIRSTRSYWYAWSAYHPKTVVIDAD